MPADADVGHLSTLNRVAISAFKQFREQYTDYSVLISDRLTVAHCKEIPA